MVPCDDLRQWLSAAANVTRQSSTASVRWHHGSSSKHGCICFPDFTFIEFRPDLQRQPDIVQDEFWGLTCNMPLKSAVIVIFKFYSKAFITKPHMNPHCTQLPGQFCADKAAAHPSVSTVYFEPTDLELVCVCGRWIMTITCMG